MKTTIVWKDGMAFNGIAGAHSVLMDAKSPLGQERGPTPKELVAFGLGGCTAMDVIALLKKHKQPPQNFSVDIDIQTSMGGAPVVFDKAVLTFNVDGAVSAEKLTEAVELSQTKYCGVSAMLADSFPIEYRVVLNGQTISTGTAHFESLQGVE